MKTAMYQGIKKLMRPEHYSECRQHCLETQHDAVDVAHNELWTFNLENFVETYFGQSEEWFEQKIMGCALRKPEQAFSREEIATYIAALRDVAKRINNLADEIESYPFSK